MTYHSANFFVERNSTSIEGQGHKRKKINLELLQQIFPLNIFLN